MKNMEKIPAKPKLPKTPAKSGVKKPRSRAKRRKKAGSADALRAVMLAGVLITVAVFISMGVIIFHSTMNPPATAKTVLIPEADPPLPVSAVPAVPPEKPAPVATAPAKPATVTSPRS